MMHEFPIVEVISAIGVGLGGMWAMFRSIQNSFLEHLAIKNGHLERIADRFNSTMMKLTETQATLIEKIDNIDRRI